MRLTFQEFFTVPYRQSGEAFLQRWYTWVSHSQLEPIIEAAETKKHWDGILKLAG
jgi:hypothetical protein